MEYKKKKEKKDTRVETKLSLEVGKNGDYAFPHTWGPPKGYKLPRRQCNIGHPISRTKIGK